MFELLPAVLIALVSCSTALSRPDEFCSIYDQTCEMHSNTHIIPNIHQDRCRILCEDSETCSHFSYYNGQGFPFTWTCILFDGCNELEECVDCSTSSLACPPCSTAVEGRIDTNLVQFLPDVMREIDCREACDTEDECRFYNYNGALYPTYPNSCFLLSRLEPPFQKSEHSRVGASDCEDECVFVMKNVTSSTSLLLTDTSTVVRSIEL